MNNSKTYKSIDLTTNCPKRREGNPCSYCYVEAAREHGFRAKQVHDRLEYNGEISRMRNSTIERLNNCGGLRVFSFGDYMPWMDEDLNRIIEDARGRNLSLKAITKVPEFVYKFHEHFAVIHISVDTIGNGIDISTARELRSQYDNVLVRSVILEEDDLDELDWTDIITLNHGNNGYNRFTDEDFDRLSKDYGDKLCCITGNCETCEVNCGV